MSSTDLPPAATTNPRPARSAIGRWAVLGLLLGFACVLILVVQWLRGGTDAEAVWNQAEAHINRGEIAPARAGLEMLGRLRKPLPQDWFLRGQVEAAEKHPDDAIAALAQVPDRHTLAVQANFMIGRIERERHRARFAEQAYRKALQLDPNLIPAHRELIYILGMQLRRREIDKRFRLLARLTPLNHHDLFTWSLTHFMTWGPDSVGDLEEFIAADPGDRASRLALASMLVDQPGEEQRVTRVLEPLGNDDGEAVALRAELLVNHNQLEAALQLLDQTTAQSPSIARLRGRIALMKRQPDQAIRQFQIALSDEPYDRVSVADLGKALLLKGDRAAAEAYLARSRKLDKVYNLVNRISRPNQENQAPDLKALGQAFEDAGLLDEALGWYTLAISRDPLDQQSQQGLKRVQALMKRPGSASVRG